MSDQDRPIVVGIIAGERSGERLGADMVRALAAQTGRRIELVGVGGAELQALGLRSVFDADDIALIGFSSVIRVLPKLIVRIGQAAKALIAARPDVIVLVDSPDFSHRVARRVKKALPDVPIVKYVAPTVWAWRPGRAAKMVPVVDAVLALFPFEPAVMARLGGPQTHYIGHPLACDEALAAVRARRQTRQSDATLRLLLLPGSRASEIKALIDDMRQTVDDFVAAGQALAIDIPTLPRHQARVEAAVADWPVKPTITTTRDAQMDAYSRADVALVASGTVTLELALADVPSMSIYRTDFLTRYMLKNADLWSGALPNIIADRIVVFEAYDHMIKPRAIRRYLSELAKPDSHAHKSVMAGYADVQTLMHVDGPASEGAARVVAGLLRP